MLADQEEGLDARILRLARDGSRAEACSVLVEAYGAEILGTCIGRMGNEMTGQDAAQDALSKALVALPNYRGTAGLRAWLHRIAANRCIDLHRSRQSRSQREVSSVEIETVAAPSRLMPLEAREQAQHTERRIEVVRAALTRVKEPDRTWVELHYTHGVTYDEIAEEAGLSRAAVKQRIWRAVKRVRALCRDTEGDV